VCENLYINLYSYTNIIVFVLSAKNLQELLISINNNFDSVADEIAEIGEESNALLNNINQNLTKALEETTGKLHVSQK
jgi:hypothetical protein